MIFSKSGIPYFFALGLVFNCDLLLFFWFPLFFLWWELRGIPIICHLPSQFVRTGLWKSKPTEIHINGDEITRFWETLIGLSWGSVDCNIGTHCKGSKENFNMHFLILLSFVHNVYNIISMCDHYKHLLADFHWESRTVQEMKKILQHNYIYLWKN